ncbi:MAG: hypothetical protein J5702_01480, partial [Bacteroidales bacterium]|nr:hypothetical protein [Bacteroidales bacterium]
MKIPQKTTDLSASLLFLVAGTVYFTFCYGFHTLNLEQLQLFEGTWAYFAQTVGVPGGFSDYLGRFLTQFCYHAWSGALVIAALLLLIRTLLKRICARKDAVVGAATFIPAVILMMTMCLRFPTLSLLTAFCLVLAAYLAAAQIRKAKTRRIVLFLLIPVLYLLAGSFVILFAAVAAVKEHNWRFSAVALVLAVACPLVASLLFPYPAGRLLYGLTYYKVHVRMPVWPWVAV